MEPVERTDCGLLRFVIPDDWIRALLIALLMMVGVATLATITALPSLSLKSMGVPTTAKVTSKTIQSNATAGSTHYVFEYSYWDAKGQLHESSTVSTHLADEFEVVYDPESPSNHMNGWLIDIRVFWVKAGWMLAALVVAAIGTRVAILNNLRKQLLEN